MCRGPAQEYATVEVRVVLLGRFHLLGEQLNAVYSNSHKELISCKAVCLLRGIYFKIRIRHEQTALCTKVFIAALCR